MHGFTRRTLIPFLLFVLFVMLFPGCTSGGHNDSPVLTGMTPSPNDITEGNVPEGDSHHACLLYCLINFDITDPNDPKFEVVPFRLSTMHLNVLKFMETAPCTDCISIENLQLTQPGVLDADIRLRNPFEDKYFTVFDVRGIIMFDGTHVFPESGLTISDPAMGDFGLLNADGYTALYNGSTIGMAGPLFTYYPGEHSSATVPNSDLNGYKRYREGFSRNVFPAGSNYIETFTIKTPACSQFVVGYAVDASWAEPVNNPVIDPETDFGPEANCCEAWKIEVFDSGPGLTIAGGSTDLTIRIHDWQGYDDTHPVVVECPDLFDGVVEAQVTNAGDNYSYYKVTIENTKLAEEGKHLLLVQKEAAENNPVSKPWLDLTAYQVASIHVKEDIGQPVEITPPWLNFNPEEVCVDGDYAYMTSGVNGLFIIDVADPVNPFYVNRVDTAVEILSVAVKGGYAYVGTGDALLIIDIDPQESACIVNTINYMDNPFYVSIYDNYLYVSGLYEFHILDITDPVNPVKVSTYDTNTGFTGGLNFGKITASSDYAYVGTSFGSWDIGGGGSVTCSLNIYDINPPESTDCVKTLQTTRFYRDIVVGGGYAYITDGDLVIMDIDPPDSAYIVGSAQTPGVATSLELSGNYAYVASKISGLDIFNIQQPDSPYLVNTINTPGSAMDVALSGDTAFIADEGYGLQIIDIGEVGVPAIIGSLEMLVDAYAVGVSGNYACVGGQKFQIVNVAQPENACIVNKIDSISDVSIIKAEEGYAYVQSDKFQIIDIDPPESAYIVKTFYLESRQFAISDGYAYLLSDDLYIIDIDPPGSAQIVNMLDMPWISYGIAVDGGYAYITARDSNDNYDGEIKVLDIDPPQSTHIIDTLPTMGEVNYGIAVAGDYAYAASNVAGDYNDIKVLNIANPESAFFCNTMGSCSDPFGIEEYGGYICTINGEDGIEVIDIDPPQSPYKVTEIGSHGFSYDIVVSGGYMYVADLSGGLRIFQFQ